MLGKLEQILNITKIVASTISKLAAYLIELLVEQGLCCLRKGGRIDRSSGKILGSSRKTES